MKRLWLSSLVLFWSVSVAADDLRVLVSFGEAGHRIEKVLVVKSSPVSAQVQRLQSRMTIKPAHDSVLLQWLDGAGGILAESVMVDPRVTHAPTHEGPMPDKFLKRSGVYLVTGPAKSKQLKVAFPPVILSSQLVPSSTLILNLASF